MSGEMPEKKMGKSKIKGLTKKDSFAEKEHVKIEMLDNPETIHEEEDEQNNNTVNYDSNDPTFLTNKILANPGEFLNETPSDTKDDNTLLYTNESVNKPNGKGNYFTTTKRERERERESQGGKRRSRKRNQKKTKKNHKKRNPRKSRRHRR